MPAFFFAKKCVSYFSFSVEYGILLFMKRLLVGICILLSALLWAMPAAAEEPEAKDYSKSCTIRIGEGKEKPNKLLDKSWETALKLSAGTTVTVSWTDEIPADRLCLQWKELREGITVSQRDADGAELSFDTLPMLPENVYPLLSETRSVVIDGGETEMVLSSLRVYGTGELPDPFHEWIETPKNLDYLLISTHPDDDVLYLGSIVPIYGADRGYTGSIVYVTNGTRGRISEAENGAWAMGLRYRPMFWGFPDIGMQASKERKATFVYDDLLKKMVQTYREYRPLVVFAQDVNGEYGHWQHVLTSKAAVEAYALAADPTYDPESAEAFGTWQVQKVYLHIYPENELIPDPNVPIEALGGKTAWQAAKSAFKKHESQQKLNFHVYRYGDAHYPFNQFGMILGTVPAGDDVFDHIESSLLYAHVTPTPEPTPTPTPSPTPEPTEEPTLTPEPTAVPTAVPTQASSNGPSAAPTDAPMEPVGFGLRTWVWFMIGGLLLIGAGIAVILVARSKHASEEEEDESDDEEE